MYIELVVVFIIGVLTERLYLARVHGLTHELGASWGISKNRIYRAIHRVYCETCPRRMNCARYKLEVERHG